ncbi:Mov34/MPN/PAD-1 family protein [Sphingomonas gellani]|uniref:Mov34/MPN/PAD-1 family protein n=1 Tax=Sphingomonas gellani TaxID=1166340 RepID=UPI001FCCCDC9|nr:M67 family metallopeptidase [Sphingomonas gellani]
MTISSALRDGILTHARRDEGREVCGLLLGGESHIAQVVPSRNVASDTRRRFEIDPLTLLAAHRAARTGATPVIGHYHSHPAGIARPSPRDAEDAAPDGSIWLIVAGMEVTAWRAVEAGTVEGRFTPLSLHVVD